MPTYEHVCENGHTFEEFQSIVAQPIEICPICGGRAERKISGGTGLIFKGSGFYINDYARKGSRDEKKSTASVKSEKPDGRSSESKPDTKPESSSSGKES